MKTKTWSSSSLSVVFGLSVFGLAFGAAGCGEPSLSDVGMNAAPVEEARHKRDAGTPTHDMSHGTPDLGHGTPDMGAVPAPNPPPASCDQRHAGVTGIQVLVQVDEYQGIIHGRNGTHEIVYGTIINTPWVYDAKIVDTSNVQLALNVVSAKDPTGLPMEIPLSPGQVVEVEGEYIPKSTASAHDAKGAAAVIHYSHTPCGYITITGHVYK